MRRPRTSAPFVLLCILAQSQAQDNGCNPNGGPMATLGQKGVEVNFRTSTITCNNLGGMGPDSHCPHEIRYMNIGTDIRGAFRRSVDLVVINLTEYKANNPERNGRTENGEFGQINLRDDFATEFEYKFVESGTDKTFDFSSNISVSFFDIDHGEGGRLRESIVFFRDNMMELPTMKTIDDVCLMQDPPCTESTLEIELGVDMINVKATDRGVGGDNAKTPDFLFDGDGFQIVNEMQELNMTRAQRWVEATYMPDMGSFRVRYEITAAADPQAGTSGRNFQLYVRGSAGNVTGPSICYLCNPDDLDNPTCGACGGSYINELGSVQEYPTTCDVGNPERPTFVSECRSNATLAPYCTPDALESSQYLDCIQHCASNCTRLKEDSQCAPTREFPLTPPLTPFTPPSQSLPPPPPSLPLSLPSPFPPPFPPSMAARKDPHLYFRHGGRADFRGAHNTTFAMLSARDVAFNVLIEEADFNWARRLVHGTKMAAAYWVVRTSTGKVLKVEYRASPRAAVVHEDGHRDVEMEDDMPAVVVDNVQISLREQTLSVLVRGKWELAATVTAFPFGNRAVNKRKRLLDISIEALYDADHDIVAPHGILGQAYDGDDLGVSGKMDKSHGDEYTTSAQAEGAIEGSWADYKLTSHFSTDFKYSRFNAAVAKPRDVSKLTGEKRKVAKGIAGATDLPAVQ